MNRGRSACKKLEFDLQGVLGRVGRLSSSHPRQPGDCCQSVAVQRNAAQWRLKGLYCGNGDPAERDVMRWPNQNDTLNILCALFQGGERCGGDGSGVSIAGVGRDDRLRPTGCGGFGGRSQEPGDFCPESVRVRGIERARHGRRSDRSVVWSCPHGIAHLERDTR